MKSVNWKEVQGYAQHNTPNTPFLFNMVVALIWVDFV